MAPKKISDAGPLSGAEMAIVIQDGKPVRTTLQDIANRAPTNTGAKGDKGDQGSVGAPGSQGTQGPKGDKGDTGDQGATGQTGSQGAQGPKGNAGDAGPQGAAGPAGPAGPKGDTGAIGATGAVGAIGSQGPKGDTGATGSQGLKGDTGAAGTPKRVDRFTSVTNASGIAAVVFSPAFSVIPDIDVIEAWSGEQMITGAVVAGTASTTGCQVQVMLSRATLLLSTGPFQKAGSGVSVTVRAIGN